jgi:hypothetical protein
VRIGCIGGYHDQINLMFDLTMKHLEEKGMLESFGRIYGRQRFCERFNSLVGQLHWGKILIVDNLQKGAIIVDWFCMCEVEKQ